MLFSIILWSLKKGRYAIKYFKCINILGAVPVRSESTMADLPTMVSTSVLSSKAPAKLRRMVQKGNFLRHSLRTVTVKISYLRSEN